MKKLKVPILGALSVCLSGGLIAFLISKIDIGRATEVVRQASWPWLLFAAVVTCCIPFTSVIRWRGVLGAQGNLRLPFFVTLRAVMIANVLNSFLPSKAGDMAKAAYLRKHGGFLRGIGTVALERLVDLGMLGLLGIIGLLWSGAKWGFISGAALLGGVTLAFFSILFFPFEKIPFPKRIAVFIEDMREIFRRWLSHPASMAQTLVGSFLTWSLGGFTVGALARALGADLSWGYAYSIFPLAVLAGLVPVTVSGIGTRDTAFAALLSRPLPLEEAVLVGIGYTLFAYWFLSLISFPVVAWELGAYFHSRGEKQRNERSKCE